MYIQLDHVRLYYEEYGQGCPVILLHGNGEDHQIFGKLVNGLKEKHKVYAIDSRCHGKSEDPDELSYDLITEDVIAFIKKKKIGKPVLYGFSDGGIVGLLLAIREPELLSRLIISGANLEPSGMKWTTLTWCKIMYFFNRSKYYKMMITQPYISVEDLKKIRIPVHVLAGEKDVIKREHTKKIADSIENSTLEIVAGEDHGSYIVNSEKIFSIVRKYLPCSCDPAEI